ncbi:tripartite tricarboxylate transporter permease [Roseibium suaedae]|uniref:Putative tricarboxylic transport membrane protein n=1 Tax=Roseibium suaedae TaxID=735517 RepID=A0A1M7NMM3_9HYPH|nr:tripartite tricarboxylate transporter permease [Roseibium suaedae]SHN05013.1 putative tricarboxylic transport membrane protein [Roseibium suaedae]
MFDMLLNGLGLVASLSTVILVGAGLVIGLLVGALPGLGPLMGIILLLPYAITFPPVQAMGFLIAIYVGGSCGGAISAILLRIPGTPLAAATLFDGYPMAQKGRAADAIGIAISASAIGGAFGGLILILFSPSLAAFAAGFGPPEYALLAITGLTAIAAVSDQSMLKGLIAGAAGLLLATIGTDEFTAAERFTFGLFELSNGFNIVAIVVGLFAISEMSSLLTGDDLLKRPELSVARPGFRSAFLVLKRWPNLLRSSTIGACVGALPGAGGVISSFTAYAVAKTFAKPEERYGEGAEGGIVASESANNATAGGALVPTLALGIPGDAATAVLIGALLILGVFPGPTLFAQHSDIVGGIFLVYMLANVALFVVGILMTPLFVYVLRLRKVILIPTVLLLCAIGTFAVGSSIFDLWVMFAFGFVGLILRAGGYPLAPMVIGVILGPLLENNVRRSLLLSNDGLQIFIERPVSATLLFINVALLICVAVFALRRLTAGRKPDILQGSA